MNKAIANLYRGDIRDYKKTDTNHLLTLNVRCDKVDTVGKRKSLILIVDVSSSMREDMNILKRCVEGIASIMKDLPEEKKFNMNVIVFGRDARHIFDGTDYDEMARVFNNVTINGLTNLHDALRLAFEYCLSHKDMYHWLLLLSDGEPTTGNIQDRKSMKKFVDLNKPPNSHIIAIGLREDIDLKLLHNIGVFVYIHTVENINHVLSMVVTEITESYGVSCKIKTPKWFNERKHGDEEDDHDTVIIGGLDIGTVYNDRLIKVAIRVSSLPLEVISGNSIPDIELEYMNFDSETVKLNLPVVVTNENIPDEWFKSYYDASSVRLCNFILDRCHRHPSNAKVVKQQVNKKLELWNEEVAGNAIATVKRVLQNRVDSDTRLEFASINQGNTAGLSYTPSQMSQRDYITPSQQQNLSNMSNYFRL